MKKKEKIKKYTKIFETLLFITIVINILLFAYKKENILSRANYKILVQESEGSSNYVAYNSRTFPKSGYTFASYECENGGTVTQTSKGVFSYTGDSDSCVLKFDISPFSCEDDSLYCVLANEANDGGLAAKYNGEHADAFDRSGTEDIYYFTTPIQNDETQGNQLLDKWNVLFGGFCWQMFRTTDTGGVKMIYNGVPSNGTCNNTGTAQQIGTSSFNSNYNSPAYVGYMYNTVYETKTANAGAYMYGNSFTYSNGTYTLTDTVSTSGSATASDLENHHYTCFNTTGTCSSISYIYYLSSSIAYYISLTNGKSVEDALDEMLFDDNVNTTNSTVKTYIDNWYQNNLSNYASFLEDTVFCNNREIYAKDGWNPNGGKVYSSSLPFLKFSSYHEKKLICTNNADRFSTLNNLAKLTYPIGLASHEEMNLLNNNIPRNNDNYYWLFSPLAFIDSEAYVSMITSGSVGFDMRENLSSGLGVRPVISLKPGTEYIDGDGSRNNPYIVSTSKAQTTLVKLQKLNSNIQVNSGTPNFSQTATTDEGLYSSEDDYGTSYYWRGAATTNYIQFGKNSSNQDLYWRIIRINGDGSLRLMYAGTSATAKGNIGTSAYNSDTTTNNGMVGYMYGSTNPYIAATYEGAHMNATDSTIKTFLDNWYNNNIANQAIENYISDTEFCYDRSIIDSSTGDGSGMVSTNYAPMTRNQTNKNPSLLCTQKNDRFTVNDEDIGNGALTKSIGLINADEAAFSGLIYNSSNNNSAFTYKNSDYWTGSAWRFVPNSAYDASISSNGNIIDATTTTSKAVVPVINITPEAVNTLTGTGTSADPFVVH